MASRSVFAWNSAVRALLLFLIAGAAIARERLVELSFTGLSERSFVVLYEEVPALYIDIEDLAEFGVDTRSLEPVAIPNCGFCLDLSLLGEVDRTPGDTRITVRLNAYGVSLFPAASIAGAKRERRQAVALPGAFFNYAVTGYESKAAAETFGALLEGGASIGDYGVLRYGHVLSSVDAERRYYTRYELDIDAITSQLVVGDVATRPGPLAGSTRLAGISLRRNALMAPEVLAENTNLYSPLDSTLTSFDVYRLGNFSRGEIEGSEYVVDDVYVAAGSNSIKILLRDRLGREQLIERSLVDSRGVLSRGALDYALDVGYRYDPLADEYRDVPVAAGRLRYGVSDNLTAGYYGITNNGATFSSGGIETSTAIGQFSIGGGYGYVREIEGSPGSQKRWGMEAAYSRVYGSTGFFVSAFRNLVDTEILTGASFGFRVQTFGWPIQATLIHTDQFRAVGVLARRSFGNWTVAIDGRGDDAGMEEGYSFSLLGSVAYNFGKNTAQASVQHRNDGQVYSSAYYMRTPDGKLTVSAGVDRSDNDGGPAETRPTGSLTYNDYWIEADLASQSDQRGMRTNSGIVAGGLALFDGQVLPIRRVYPTSTIAVASVDADAALIEFDGLAVPINRNGIAAAPIWAWNDARISIDPNSLPSGWASAESSKSVVGRAGSFVTTKLNVERLGYFLEVPWIKSSRVRVNGNAYEHYRGDGAYVTEKSGRTVIEVDGKTFNVDLPEVGADVPTFVLDQRGRVNRR